MNGNTLSVLTEVADERAAQDEKFGSIQNIPDGTGPDLVRSYRLAGLRHKNDRGEATFLSVLEEEIEEAALEDDPVKLRAELVQVAAVAVKWIEHIDRRSA
jgi:hypothetical protein